MTEEIIGREEEQKQLGKFLSSQEPELYAVYGRRRVGKTFLISRFFQDKGLYFEITGVSGGTTREQLRKFPGALREAFCLQQTLPIPKNWDEAFDQLLQEIKKIKDRKIILFFDELPWLASPKSGLLSSLEYLWNRYLSRMANVIVILCGSAASWMIKKIINNRGGLYGRLTGYLHLQPFSLLETERFLQTKKIYLERKQLIEIYMATGGIPKYLNHIEKGLSSSQIIQSLCFAKSGFLSTEYKGLFESLFDNSRRHSTIIEILGKHRQGLTLKQIAEATSLSLGGRITDTLNELESSGFIQSIPFYGKKKQESQYRLIDEYCLFYLTWIRPAIFQKNQPINEQYWLNQHRSPQFLSWCGYAFENICFKHINQIVEDLKISIIAKTASYWNYKQKKSAEIQGAEIDLIIERTDKSMHLCEIKFHGDVYSMTRDYSKKMNSRRDFFRRQTQSKSSIFNTLITPYGAHENPSYLSCIDQQIDLDGLFGSK